MNSADKKIYSGTSGLVVDVPKTLYPPEFQGKSRLQYYASLFNSMEINSTFYKMPMIATVIKWAASVPENFRFTFKLLKLITHAKGFSFKPEDIELFMKTIAHAGNKKGCLLIQFPPALKIEKLPQLEKLLIALRLANPHQHWKVALEFRNRSWYHQQTYDLLDQHNITMVIHDLPASATPLIKCKANFMYLRFHGPGGKYRGSYSDDFLSEYANHINAWKNEGKTIYVYFNNTMGDAFKNLQTLNSLLH